MTPVAPAPLALAPPTPPDRDFDLLRAEAIGVLVEEAGATWTDHNLSDPGITLLEALVWGIADLHYRTATREFASAPLELPLWRDPADRAWYGLPDLGDPQRLIRLADTMAAPAPPAGSGRVEATRMAELIQAADSRRAAIGTLVDNGFGTPPLAWEEASAAVAILRAPLVRRATLDHSDAVAAAWTEGRRTIERRAAGGAIDEDAVDAEAVRLLGFEPGLAGLWEDEVRSLIRRHRHRRFLADVAALQSTFAPADGAAMAAGPQAAATSLPTVASLQRDLGVGPEDALAALALHPCPADEVPESWEKGPDESTTTWPPHPLQALTTEPVTGDDYATRARTLPDVRRAWAVPGALKGVGWDGRERPASDAGRLGAVTLLVEPLKPPSTPERERTLLRAVLAAVTAGPGEPAEAAEPYDQLMTPNLQVPRRLMCDELGAALIQECPITLTGVLHVTLGADRTTVIDAALARVAVFLAGGRPESATGPARPVACPKDIEGPWPPAPQPEGGWQPGEAIRVNELVQVLGNDPLVLGVDGLQVQVGGTTYAAADGVADVPLDPDCVPVLDPLQCLQVRLELAADCGRG